MYRRWGGLRPPPYCRFSFVHTHPPKNTAVRSAPVVPVWRLTVVTRLAEGAARRRSCRRKGVIRLGGSPLHGLMNCGRTLQWLTCGLLATAAVACTWVPTHVIYAPPESITVCSHPWVGKCPRLLCRAAGAGLLVSSRATPATTGPFVDCEVVRSNAPCRVRAGRTVQCTHGGCLH